MEVELAQVKPRVPGPGDAHEPVEVGLVVHAQPPRGVDDVHELADLLVVDAGVLGVGDEQGGGVLRHGGLQGLQVGDAALVGVEGDDLVPQGGGGAGVAGVGEDGGDDLVALFPLPPGLVIGVDHRHVGENPLGPPGGVQAEPVHAGDGLQVLLGLVHHLEDALGGGLVLVGVQLGKPGVPDEALVDLGVVLHGAGAQADVDVDVRPDGLLGQAEVVAQQLHLPQLRQFGGLGAAVAGGDGIPGGLGHLRLDGLGEDGPLARGPHLHEDGLIPPGLVKVSSSVQFHWALPPKISARAAHRVWMSAAVVVSLTQ